MPPRPAPVSAVPRRMRLLCALVAAVVVAVGLFVALTLQSNSTGVIEFGAADQVAVAGLACCSAPACCSWAGPGWTPTPRRSASATSS